MNTGERASLPRSSTPLLRYRFAASEFSIPGSSFSIFFLLLLTLVTVSPQATRAEPTTAIVTGTERVFVRRGPGNEFPPFASIPSGSTVDVQEMTGEWARIVTASGQVGYINVNFLALPGEPERRPTAARPTWTRPAAPTRTWTARPTNSPASPSVRPTSPPTPPTSRPTSSPTRTRTGARATVTSTPTAEPPTATPSPSSDAAALHAMADRNKTLEGEVMALRQEVAELKRHGDGTTPCAGSVNPLSAPEVKAELVQLAAAVESLQRRAESVPAVSDPPALAATNTDTGSHVVSPIAVFLGMAGIVIGWMLGSSYVRKQDRSRRSRLRF